MRKSLEISLYFFSIAGFILLFSFVYYHDFIGAALIVTVIRGLIGFFVMLKSKKLKRENLIKN